MSGDYQSRLSQTMSGLKDRLSVLIEDLPRGAPIVYFDQPVHLNVGDLLINLGLERLLAAHHCNVTHRLSAIDYERFMNLVTPGHVLVMHGGGNLGDIWPTHEKLRQNVLKSFPRNKIVVFPQSVHFNNEALITDYAAAYRAHPDCKIFVRDQHSLEMVEQRFGVPCALSPDTAHYLWDEPEFSAGEGSGELLFTRTDLETTSQGNAGVDWDDLISPLDFLLYKVCRGSLKYNPVYYRQPLLMKMWYMHRDSIILKSANYFRKFSNINTDRLHAVILSLLLRKKVAKWDNSYGKLGRYCDLWLPGLVEAAPDRKN